MLGKAGSMIWLMVTATPKIKKAERKKRHSLKQNFRSSVNTFAMKRGGGMAAKKESKMGNVSVMKSPFYHRELKFRIYKFSHSLILGSETGKKTP